MDILARHYHTHIQHALSHIHKEGEEKDHTPHTTHTHIMNNNTIFVFVFLFASVLLYGWVAMGDSFF